MESDDLDWQIGLHKINERACKLLDSEKWSDCVFLVGSDGMQQSLVGHKIILGMSSPVFEAMFFGSLASKEDKPIKIPDVQPQAFRAMIKYIYSDKVVLENVAEVLDICYAGKKYMISALVGECVKYIGKNLNASNVCHACPFIRLFEEPQLFERCMQVFQTMTEDVLKDPSFEEVDLLTLKSVLSQVNLNVSEIDLWNAVVRWSEHECKRQSIDVCPSNQRQILEVLVPLFRFLNLTPTQFANGPATSEILSQEECFALLMNISAPGVTPVPPTLSSNATTRRPPPTPSGNLPSQQLRGGLLCNISGAPQTEGGQMSCHCAGPLADIFINDGIIDCALSFTVDRDIRVVGFILPTQMRPYVIGNTRGRNLVSSINTMDPSGVPKYPELLYAFLQDGDGCRLTYTHFSAQVPWESTMEVLFNRPVYINPNVTYKIVVVLNKPGRYPIYVTNTTVVAGDVTFSFEDNPSSESVLKTLLFKLPRQNPMEPLPESHPLYAWSPYGP